MTQQQMPWMSSNRRSAMKDMLTASGMTARDADETLDLTVHAVQESGRVVTSIAARASSEVITAQVILLQAQIQLEICEEYLKDVLQTAAELGCPAHFSRPA